ncbi:hypothetical protein [Nocardia sp. CNY236]|uniref:hypothetical protein n=1 Tax=Nocardia sp. CNY236 TaxID=1169152 RepID=UPI000422C5A2|nr:hypothetical protein [Nocardia sp. CNY236]
MINTLGGIPVVLADVANVDSPVPIGFRRLALTVVDGSGPAELAVRSEGLSVADRHAAARTATAVFVSEIRLEYIEIHGKPPGRRCDTSDPRHQSIGQRGICQPARLGRNDIGHGGS